MIDTPNLITPVTPKDSPTPRAELMNRFESAQLDEAAAEKVDAMRAKVKTLANHINKHVPASREKSLALTNLEQTLFWSNAAIARHQ